MGAEAHSTLAQMPTLGGDMATEAITPVQESGDPVKIDFWYLVKVGIVFFLMFGFGYLEPIPPLEKIGMQVVGIFLGMLFAWMGIGYVWPSILALIALWMTGYAPLGKIVATGFGNSVTVFLIMILVFVIYLEKMGLCNRIAYWFLSRKFIVGRPWFILLIFFTAAYVMAIVTYSYPAMIIPWTIAYALCAEVGYKQGEKFPALMIIGIGVSALMGFTALPIKSTAVVALGLLDSTTQGAYSVNFFDYILLMIPLTYSVILVYLGLMRFVFKADVEKLKYINTEKFQERNAIPVNFREMSSLTAVLVFIIFMCIPSILPQDMAITKFFKGLGMNGTLLLVICILGILHYRGQSLMPFSKIANSGHLGWDVIIMTACSFSICGALEDKNVGVTNMIVQYASPFLENLHPLAFLIFAMLFLSLLTQVMHNLVIAAVFTPLMVNFSLIIGLNPSLLCIFLIFAYSFSVVTPASSGVAALIFLNEWTSKGLCYKTLTLLYVLALLLTLFVYVPTGFFLFR